MKRKGSDEAKKNAFTILLQSSPATCKTQESKKRRLTDSGESTRGTCPVCGASFSANYIQQHVDSCLRSLSSAKSVTPSSKNDVHQQIGKTPGPEQLDAQASGLSAEQELREEKSTGQDTCVGDERGDSNAFSRLMQRQRTHSRIHNFYLEKLPGPSFRWHWFLTSGASESRLAQQLAATSEAPSKDPEFAKGAVNPDVRWGYGIPRDQSARKAQENDSGVSNPNLSPQTGLMPQPTMSELAPRAHEQDIASAREPHEGTCADNSVPDQQASGLESWQDLPPARWHAMTQMLASRIGGPPKLKLSVRLLTNLRPGDGGPVCWDSAELASNRGKGPQFRGSISVLKSAMQKNVRLCRPESALRCGLHILKEDPSEFLRRSAVICLEDSLLHPALPMLVWSMAAHSKGYILGRSVLTKCLAVLYHIAHSPIRDTLHLEGGRKFRSSMDLFEQAKGLTGEKAVLVRVILLRAAFGGMPGDMQLLQGFAQMWSDRFCGFEAFEKGQNPAEASKAWQDFLWSNVAISHDSIADKDSAFCIESIKAVTREDIPESAVDFHVSSIVEDLLNDSDILAKAKELKKDAGHLLRQSMWKFRSGISNKEKKFAVDASQAHDSSEQDLKAFWQTASPRVEAWTANFLTNRFS